MRHIAQSWGKLPDFKLFRICTASTENKIRDSTLFRWGLTSSMGFRIKLARVDSAEIETEDLRLCKIPQTTNPEYFLGWSNLTTQFKPEIFVELFLCTNLLFIMHVIAFVWHPGTRWFIDSYDFTVFYLQLGPKLRPRPLQGLFQWLISHCENLLQLGCVGSFIVNRWSRHFRAVHQRHLIRPSKYPTGDTSCPTLIPCSWSQSCLTHYRTPFACLFDLV